MKRFKTRQVYVAFLMLILSVLLITGCGTSGSDIVKQIEAQSDSVAPGTCTKAGPAVTSSNPTDGDVGVTNSTADNTGKLITVNFSEAMDPATIVSADAPLTFTLNEHGTIVYIKGAVTMNAAHTTATFTTDEALKTDTEYTATITTAAESAKGASLSCSYRWSFTTGASAAAGQAWVGLGTAGDFVILAKTTITDPNPSTIIGNIGLSPAAGSAIIVTCPEMTGSIYTVDATYVGSGDLTCVKPGPGANGANKTLVDGAIVDTGAAYADAASRSPGYTERYAGILDGHTFVPGVYKWSTDVSIGTDVTLSGSSSDVWIFEIAGNLNIASKGSVLAGTKVILTGGAQAKNVFWQVGGGAGATLGTYSTFNGIILSATQVVMQYGAVLNGRAFAHSEVTLDANAITAP